MDVLEEEDKKESIITFEDFPLICRICCLKKSELRPFQDEEYLWDLFHAIRRTDVNSTDTFPKNVCNGCITKLEGISRLISKYKDTRKEKNWILGKELENVRSDESSFLRNCCICSSPIDLKTFENTHPLQLLQNITGSEVPAKIDLTNEDKICCSCIDELEHIYSFIRFNDEKLKKVIENQTMNKISPEANLFFGGTKEKHEIIDIKENFIALELASSVTRIYQSESDIHQCRARPDDNYLPCCEKSSENKELFISLGKNRYESEHCKLITKKSSPEANLFFDGKKEEDETTIDIEEEIIELELSVSKDEKIIDRNEFVEIKRSADLIDTELSTSTSLKLVTSVDEGQETNNNILKANLFFDENKENAEIIDIEVDIIDLEHSVSKDEKVIDRNEFAEIKGSSDWKGRELLNSSCWKFVSSVDVGQEMIRNSPEANLFFDEAKEKNEIIDIKEEIIDLNISVSKDEKIIGRNEFAEIEGSSDLIGTEPLTSFSSKLASSVESQERNQNNSEANAFFNENKQKREIVDIKEKDNNFEIPSSVTRIYQSVSDIHQCRARPEKYFPCCEKSSNDSDPYRHLFIPLRKNRYECENCKQMFTQLSTLQQHLPIHSVQQRFRCYHCDRSFDRKKYLRLHLGTHTEDKPYKCGCCNKSLLTHPAERPFKCDYCSKGYSSERCFANHLRTHRGVKPFKCHCCNKSFTRKHLLQRHFKRTFKCDYCSKSYSNKNYLVNHLRTHTGEKPFECDYGKKFFTQKCKLQRHLRSHSAEKPFQCYYCSKGYSLKGLLIYHLLFHTGEKPYKCDFCNKSFTRKDKFQRHLRSHTDKNPFKCIYCSSGFKVKSNLVFHLRVHTEEERFKCYHCSEGYSNKTDLVYHLRTHTGEKPYKCDSCEKIFKFASNLNRHLHAHTILGTKHEVIDHTK